MDIGAYFKPLIKWWWLILAATSLAVVTSFLVTSRQPPTFMSRATLIAGRAVYESNPSSGDLVLDQQLASIYADLAVREPVRNATMDALGLTWLPDYVVQSIPNTQLLEIVVTDSSPQRAQQVANELANQLILQTPGYEAGKAERQAFIEDQLRQLEVDIIATQDEISQKRTELAQLFGASEIAEYQSEIDALESKLSSLQQNYASLLSSSGQEGVNTLSIIEPANLVTRPVGPNTEMIVLLSGAVAFVISAGAAYLLEYLDDTLKAPDDIHKLLDLPVVGFISQIEKGKYHGDYVAKHPRSAIAESFRALRTDLEFAGVDAPLKTILVTSPGVAAGKTSIAINLAVVIAQGGKKVYLLDADLRKPSVHRSLGLPNRQGLSDAFRREKDIRDLAQFWQEGNIHVVTSGPLPPNPSELLSSHRMEQIMQTLEREADVVIIDGPPFLVTDATILSAKAEGVLLVIRYGNTKKDAAVNAVKQLQRTGARVLGVVLNQIPRKAQDYSGLYRYYAGYYAEREDEESAVPQNGKVKLSRIFARQPKNPTEPK